MGNFDKIIEKIEEHMGEKFDYSNRRHRLHLKSNVDREITKYHSLKRRMADVLNGHETFDPVTQKAIQRPQKR